MNPFYSPPPTKSTSIKFCYNSPPRQNSSLFSSSHMSSSYINSNRPRMVNLCPLARVQQKEDANKTSVVLRGKRQQKQNVTLDSKGAFQSFIFKPSQGNKQKMDIAPKKVGIQAAALTQSIIFRPNLQNTSPKEILIQPNSKQPSQQLHFSKTKPQLRKIQNKTSNAKIGEFIIGEMLGKGSIGKVFLVKHIATNFYFALKVICKSQIKDIEQLVLGIKTHCFLNYPNLTQIYACFDDQTNIYLLMELCAHGNLARYKKKIKNDEQKDRIVNGISKGISYMHYFNIRHGDLKLQNILISHGFPKITDFDCIFKGSQQQFCEKRSKSRLWGSPAYFSPSMVKQSTFSLEDDIWSLGIIMYQMYCNSHPFNLKGTDDLDQIIHKQMNPIGSEVKQAARKLIAKMLEKDRSRRAKIEQVQKYGA